MEASLMKHFITPDEFKNGKRLLPFQIEGASIYELLTLLTDRHILGWDVPVGHSLKEAWPIRLIFEQFILVEVSSACTVTTGWQEVGSLNISVQIDTAESKSSGAFERIYSSVSEFKVESVEKLVFENETLITECGIVFVSSNGLEIVVMAGIPPNSVTAFIGVDNESFSPEFPLELCRRDKFV
jgi:hypothetical protein